MGCTHSQANSSVVQEEFSDDQLSILSTGTVAWGNHRYNTLHFDESGIERRINFLDEIHRNDQEMRNRRRPDPFSSNSRQSVSEGSDSLRVAFNRGQPIVVEDEQLLLRSHFSQPIESSTIHEFTIPTTTSHRTLQPSYFPPASPQVIRKLSTITVGPHHLCDDEECPICFQEFFVGITVVRLPCGHLFHRNCIEKWLRQKCICPVCRWELATSNSLFEHGRIERMKNRKLRLNIFDLELMTIDGLLALAETHVNKIPTFASSMKQNAAFRSHLINEIKKSSRVHLVGIENSHSISEVSNLVFDDEEKSTPDKKDVSSSRSNNTDSTVMRYPTDES